MGETSEEVTRRRREERRDFKNERARREREAIEEKLEKERRKEENGDASSMDNVEQRSSDTELPRISHVDISSSQSHATNNLATLVPDVVDEKHIFKNSNSNKLSDSENKPTEIQIENKEHLQLTPEEAFFLVYGLGILEVRDSSLPQPLNIPTLFFLFRKNSSFPPSTLGEMPPDNSFMLSYVVYHHFRSLGWVVRSGVKFAVDYLLYNRGPVFSHAEFAVIILPSYRHSYWHATTERAAETKKKESKSWWWLHCVNRVQSQVRKSLVLVYVEIPLPATNTMSYEKSDGSELNISEILKTYKVREITLKRWKPNRSRD